MTIVHYKQITSVDVIHRDEVLDSFCKAMERLVVREVANMLAYKCLALDDQRDRVLEVRTERQHRAFNRQRRHRARRISARTSENYRAKCPSSDDRIVHSACNRPFADQKRICGFGESLLCVRVFICNWFS